MIKTVGVIGLGKMGLQIVQRLASSNHNVVVFDNSSEAVTLASTHSAAPAGSINELASQCDIIWLMVPAGDVVDHVLHELMPSLRAGSIVIDGGNSFYKDSIRRHALLAKQDIHFLDCGTSGGKHGLEFGFSLMIGGDKSIFEQAQSVFAALAAPGGYALMGPSGAGHYVKMVHNGIEYALLQAYSEGFHLLKDGEYKDLNLEQISSTWNHGSIIRSWILQLCQNIFAHDQNLEAVSGFIDENKTGRWTLDAAHDAGIPVKLLEDALAIRAWSRETGGNYGTKLVAMLRHEFGGHAVKTEKKV